MFQYPLDGGAEAAADLQASITEYNLRKKFINNWVANTGFQNEPAIEIALAFFRSSVC